MGWPYYSFDCLMFSLLDSLKYIWMKSCSSETYSLFFLFFEFYYMDIGLSVFWSKPFSQMLHLKFCSDIVGTKSNNDVVAALADVDYSTKGRFWRAWSSHRISGSTNWYRNWIIASCFLPPAFCLLHSRFLILAPASRLMLPCSCLLGPGSYLLTNASCTLPRATVSCRLFPRFWLLAPNSHLNITIVGVEVTMIALVPVNQHINCSEGKLVQTTNSLAN